MNQLLAPGETMIYRAKPAWRAVALLIGAGLGVALVFHVIVGLWDDNWRCPASLMVLGFTALLGIALSSAASKTEAIVTDQRVYYRGADDQLVVIRRSDITDVELLEDEVPIAAVRICDRHGLETTAKLLAAPRSFHSVLLGEAEIPAREPETLRGAVFVLTAFTCAAFVALNAVTAFGGVRYCAVLRTLC